MIEVKLACDSVMVMSKQGRLNGKTEQEVGESEGSERWRGARAEEGDDGCENQKIKEVSPCPREESRVVDVRFEVITASSCPMKRTSDCLVTQNDRNVGPSPSSEPIERHQSNM